MTDGTFEDGFRHGWESVAGDAFPPPETIYPPEGDPRDYRAGFQYGKSEAAMRFRPGAEPTPI